MNDEKYLGKKGLKGRTTCRASLCVCGEVCAEDDSSESGDDLPLDANISRNEWPCDSPSTQGDWVSLAGSDNLCAPGFQNSPLINSEAKSPASEVRR